MKKEYRNIIFDFDGTLVDTASLIVETMRRTIDSLSLPSKSEAECRSMIGYRLEEIPAILWPDIPGLPEIYAASYRRIFSSIKDAYKISLYPDVSATLKALHEKGINMAIASSRSRASIEEYIHELGISEYFQALVGGGDVIQGKPFPEPVEKILSSQGWDREETLVVGDMSVDILMGKRAGADTCGVTYGNGSVNDLREAGATHIINKFGALAGICGLPTS